MNIRPDSLVEELQRLAPELRVRGGSFAHWLPEPPEAPRNKREGILVATQREATGKCLTDLLASVGLPSIEPGCLPSGARSWPEGYTGSVSRKGTKVVAAIAPTNQMRTIGIDIERLDGKGLPTLDGLDPNEQPYAVSDNDGQIILFSVKEAVVQGPRPDSRAPARFHRRRLVLVPNRLRIRLGSRPRKRRYTRRTLLYCHSIVGRVSSAVGGAVGRSMWSHARDRVSARQRPRVVFDFHTISEL